MSIISTYLKAGFFRLDLQAYRSSHSDVLTAMVREVVESGLSVTVEAESHIPALRHVDVSTGLHH